MTIDRAAAETSRRLATFLDRHSDSVRILDAYPIIASSPTSWTGMRDTIHPIEGSPESHVLMMLFLNLACQKVTSAGNVA